MAATTSDASPAHGNTDRNGETTVTIPRTGEPPIERPPRNFISGRFDPADVAEVESVYRHLLKRDLNSLAALELWMADFSELSAVMEEYASRKYIDKSCHTDDPNIEKAYLFYVEHIEPAIKPLYFELQKKYLACPLRTQLDPSRFAVMDRRWQADVELFRAENVPLETDVIRLVTDYDKICGAMIVQFRGKDYTMPQLARFIEEPDRHTRQEAYEVGAVRRLHDREAIEAIFDKLLPLRQAIAANAGLENYRDFCWKSYKRFDYKPDDCLKFADAIEATCVPLVAELDRGRADDLRLEQLRPWDLSVDPKNRPPLRPFREDQTPLFVDKTQGIFHRLSPDLGHEFESLRQHGNLDLESRKGKQPGGYQCSLEEVRQPFIFMNAAGLQRDVETLLHEGGHAFHYLAARDEPLVFLRGAPMEFCEVASMSMELLGSEHFNMFYNDADAARAKRNMLEGIIRFLPWMATIDSFQHWIYTHPRHDRVERASQWVALMDRFGSKLDWTGHEATRESQWQRQLHLFHAPFYYIEYGIAQLGALQLWTHARADRKAALASYRAGLALGGKRPLPELFAAAGIKFDFSDETLRPLMDAVGEELARLPA